MKKYWTGSTKKIFYTFVAWKLWVLIFAFLGVAYVPLAGVNFFGGGLSNYLKNPLFFGWANFDGEHYLSIAQISYRGLEQAFFPLYPMLMRFLTNLLSFNFYSLIASGIFISNISLLLSLIILWKLIRLDFPDQVSILTIILLLSFPTSFYFGAVYNESLYLLLSLLAFYFARRDRWFLAGLLGGISSGTRIFGILLLPALIIEAIQRKVPLKKSIWVILIPVGLISYMYYQWVNFGDPLAFYNLQLLVGEQHQRGIILLPQVFFRYIKMVLSTETTNPIFQTVILEFATGIIFTILPIYALYKKMRFSYVFYSFFGFILPTIQGSFSSVPRYVLVLFPSFIAAAILISKLPKIVRIIITSFLLLLLGFETMLFIRGYWVA